MTDRRRAGPVGLTLAIDLGRAVVRCLLIERSRPRCPIRRWTGRTRHHGVLSRIGHRRSGAALVSGRNPMDVF